VNYREKAEQEVGCTCSDTMCVAKRARFERALREAAAEALEAAGAELEPEHSGYAYSLRVDAQRIREGRD
jgi:hypothetical protein